MLERHKLDSLSLLQIILLFLFLCPTLMETFAHITDTHHFFSIIRPFVCYYWLHLWWELNCFVHKVIVFGGREERLSSSTRWETQHLGSVFPGTTALFLCKQWPAWQHIFPQFNWAKWFFIPCKASVSEAGTATWHASVEICVLPWSRDCFLTWLHHHSSSKASKH